MLRAPTRFLLLTTALAAVLSLTAGAAPPQPGAIPLEINALLDAYGRGDRDQAMAVVGRAAKPQAQALRTMLVSTGHSWAHAVQTDLKRRLLIAAAFAVEFEAVRVERGDWLALVAGPAGPRHTIEWGCTILRARGPADDAERTWFLSSFALANGVRDWSFLYAPTTPPGPRTRVSGHVLHALARFPNDPQFKLARAIAIGARYDVTDEMQAPREGERTGPVESTVARPLIVIRDPGGNFSNLSQGRSGQIEYAKQEMAALVSDAAVGAHAQMRLSYLHWRLGEYDEAVAAAREAVTKPAITVDQKYVAFMVAAQASQAAGRFDAADAFYSDALGVRADSQSATIGQAALRFFRGDAASAYDLVEQMRTKRPHDDDPWRLYLYGEYPHLPELIGRLRGMLQP